LAINIHDYWYDIPVGPELRQGDIFRRLLVMWFPQDLPVGMDLPRDAEELTVKPEWAVGDWIVLSASCDVDRNAQSYPQAILGRVLPVDLETFGAKTEKELMERTEVVRKGLEPTKFLLPEHPGTQPPFPLSIVTYRVHHTMPTDYLRRNSAGRRLRLKHPFRESFGTWVAANIGRVGPETSTLIPEFIKTYPAHTLKANRED
jgi:hypothetical protein